MKSLTRRQILFGVSLLTIMTLLVVFSRNAKIREFNYDPAFNAEIQAFTSHEISRKSPIVIRLAANAVPPALVGKTSKESPFKFRPHIPGTIVWTDVRTVEFRPDNPLPSDTYYEATFSLGDFFQELPPARRTFSFQFATLRQSMEVIADGTESIDDKSLKWQIVNGTCNTADFEFVPLVEKTLSATQAGKALKIKWTHTADGRSHKFVVDSVKRGDRPSEVLLNWDSEPMGLSLMGEKSITIPAQGEFYALSAIPHSDPEQFVEIKFSDPLNPQQDLRGLITMGTAPLRFIVDGSIVKVYPQSRLIGNQTLSVETGVKNVMDYRLQKRNSWEVTFEQINPEVRLYGSGTILPRNGALPFVFEAVSLKAVNVSVMRIYEKNVLQFLQINELNENSELYRVGKEIVTNKEISLEGNPNQDLHSWNRHVIDLTSIVKTEPGAIYRISISFDRKQSIYQCGGRAGEAPIAIEKGEDADKDGPEAYYDDDYGDYWSHRDDPCHRAYFEYDNHEVSRNILASDLGIIAKRGTEGTMNFAITDLRTTAPIPNVIVELYDFQQQLIKRVLTGANGLAQVDCNEEPFVMVAKLGQQRGYLKLQDGYSLSLSKFDVEGETYKGGVKGYLYGERGVWRPGDSLYLTFLLEDEHKSLPPDHPVTLTLHNPHGKAIRTLVKKDNVKGVYTFATATSPDAPTGNYLAVVSIGGSEFSKVIKVETIMPNRLKINLKFEKEYLLAAGSASNKAQLHSQWLHGAPANSLHSEVKVSLRSVPTRFTGFDAFTFDDPVRKFSSEEKVMWMGQLDENGNSEIPFDIKPGTESSGKLMANFTVHVFESGGNFSVDYFSMPWFPYDRFVGIKTPAINGYGGMLETGKEHPIEIAMVDPEGKRTGNDSVQVTLYKLNWAWWWDQSYENVTAYNGNFYNEIVSQKKVMVKNGAGQYKLKVEYPNWGRYLLRVEDKMGHIAGKVLYIDFPGEDHHEETEESAGATLLTFTSDKQKYAVGEQVSLTIPTGKTGRALVSIECGSRVVHTGWLVANGTTSVYKFKTTADMAPNVYAHVTLLQPHSQTANDLPIRMYGVIPIDVYNPQSQLHPVVTTPDHFKPEQKASVTVKEANGRPMVYTVAIVDEGLLDLTRFKTPDPWNTFYAKEALDVKTWDLYDQVIGAYNGDLSRLLSIGGDGEGNNKGGAKVNRFRPVVKFLGPFSLGAGQTKTHTFDMPNYVGSVKTMVVARWETAYGNAEKQTPVRNPLLVLGTLPRVVGPGEEIKLPVTIFAMENHIKNVNVKIQVNDFFQFTGESQQTLTFSTTGDQLANFSLRVKEKPGIGTVKIIATSGKETAVYHVDVEVRLSNPPVTVTERASLLAGQNWTKEFDYPGISGTNKGSVEVSSLPPMNLGKRMNYLVQYPHGCIEQTTSAAFPQVYLSSLLDLSEEKKREVEKNINAGVNRIVGGFQTSTGGLSYWPGESNETDWGTNYAGAFLLEAKKRGFRVPADFLSRWVSFQTSRARLWDENVVEYKHDHWRESNHLIQADRLYLLALAGAPELGSMNRLRETQNLYIVAQWRLAAAYKLAGQPEIAAQLTQGLSANVMRYRELSYSYGSHLRDQALILECMTVLGLRERGKEIAKIISDELSTNNWCSTQETGYCLVALAKYFGVTGNGNSTLRFSYRLNDGAWTEVATSKALAMIDMKPGATTHGKMEVRNQTGEVLFVRISTTGVPLEGKEKAFNGDIALSVLFKNDAGAEINPTRIEQGTDFYVEVTVANNSSRKFLEEMALTMIFPSGWEIHNRRMAGEATEGEYQDFRDDRVYSYFDLTQTSGSYRTDRRFCTFRFNLNASYLGKFYLPMWKCVAMYDEDISAGTAGQWVEVVAPE